jgi:hypothetical protein
MNWLINLTGKKDGFRGADWVIESNNLMHKVVHAGGGANRTLENVIKESPLILAYRQAYEAVEANFHLTKSTLHHPPPNMTNTLAMMRAHIEKHQIYSHITGRTLSLVPTNSVTEGVRLGMLRSVAARLNEPSDDGDGDEGADIDWDNESAFTDSELGADDE